jgi:hypothetical protein
LPLLLPLFGAVASRLPLPFDPPLLLLPKPCAGNVLFDPQAAAVSIDAKPMPATSETRRNETGDAWFMGNSGRWALMWGGI